MRGLKRTFIAALTLAALFSAFAVNAGDIAPRNVNRPNAELAALNGKRLGILSGTMHDTAANRAYDYTQIEYFDDVESLLYALLNGEVDAVIADDPVARAFTAEDLRFRKLPGNLQDDDYAFALRQEDHLLFAQVNAIMNDLVNEGIIIGLIDKWIDGPMEGRVMPELNKSGSGDPLRFGVSAYAPPFVYRDTKSRIFGLDIELANLIAGRLDRPLQVVAMPFSELIPALVGGSVDMIGTALSVTKERTKIVRFTRTYFRGGVSAIVLDDEKRK